MMDLFSDVPKNKERFKEPQKCLQVITGVSLAECVAQIFEIKC